MEYEFKVGDIVKPTYKDLSCSPTPLRIVTKVTYDKGITRVYYKYLGLPIHLVRLTGWDAPRSLVLVCEASQLTLLERVLYGV